MWPFDSFRYYADYKKCVKAGQENFRQMQTQQAARWAEIARAEDCWYKGGAIVAPMHDYWSDGSIKRDRWTGRTFPKGLYFLDSQGYNATGVKIPPNAKKCPS